jgi:hypothetical protein
MLYYRVNSTCESILLIPLSRCLNGSDHCTFIQVQLTHQAPNVPLVQPFLPGIMLRNRLRTFHQTHS